MKNIFKIISVILALCFVLTACKGSDTKNPSTKDPYSQENIKKLSEITSATDADYGDALVAETELWSDSQITTGNVTYTETEDLPDISKKFPEVKTKEYSYKDFEVYAGDAFVKSGISQVNSNYQSIYSPDSKVIRVDFGKDFEITKIKVKWAGTKAVRCTVQVADELDSWFDCKEITFSKKKNEVEVEVNETHRRYLQLYFASEMNVSDVSEFTIVGGESNPKYDTPSGPETNGIARPTIFPIADSVVGVENPVISLAGTWKFTAEPEARFWENDADISKWVDVPIPGDPDNQNVGIRTKTKNKDFYNLPTAYKLRVNIPKDYKDKEVILHFDGVVNYSRIFVNGQLVRTHRFGCTVFDCIITDYVEAGKDAIITVEASFEILSTESGLITGFTGYPKLMAVPKESLSRIQYECDLDSSYKNAEFTVSTAIFSRSNPTSKIKLTLTDAEGKEVILSNNEGKFTKSGEDLVIKNTVKDVITWNSDNPYLYTLKAELLDSNGKVTETVIKKVGFKEIEINGNQFLVNGSVAKLHGVNWYNVSPTGGLVADYWSDRASLIKLAAANINFIRTAHHPQYSYVFDICDELGIYVEEESALAMVCDDQKISYEMYELLVNPKYANRIINQYAEMVEGSRSHASTLYYSIGNESSWGENITAGMNYIKAVDGKHPTKFSWGYNAKGTDIFSIHYPQKSFLMYNPAVEIPHVYDENTHLYTQATSLYYDDPSIRALYDPEFYWDSIYKQVGGLGSLVWTGRDMATLTPTGPEKYFVRLWGLLDTWNREKEEYWIVKKAYSPIKIDETLVLEAPSSGALEIPLENRFQTDNLKDKKVECTVNGKKVDVSMPDVKAMSSGTLRIEGSFKSGDVVHLTFRNPQSPLKDLIVDEYEFVLGGIKAEVSTPSGTAPSIKDEGSSITVSGDKFKFVFNKQTGKITDGSYNNVSVIVGGPDLDLGVALSDWKLSSISAETVGSEAVISISGSYKTLPDVTFKVKIDGTGRLDTEYSLKIPSGTEKLGVSYVINETTEYSWQTKGIKYNLYPENSVARLKGTAVPNRKTDKVLSILEKPNWDRFLNTTTFGVEDDGTKLTDDYRATKRNLCWAELKNAKNVYFRVESDGKGAVKVSQKNAKDKTLTVGISSDWGHIPHESEAFTLYPIDLVQSSGQFTGNVVIRLCDTSLSK